MRIKHTPSMEKSKNKWFDQECVNAKKKWAYYQENLENREKLIIWMNLMNVEKIPK